MTSPTKHQPQSQEIPGPRTNVPDKRRKTMIAKRRHKVRVHTQPTPSTPISTGESILVTVYKLAMEQFAEVPCPTNRSLNDNTNPPPLEDIPSAPVRQSTPWPNAGSASENLFKTRKDWPITPTPVPTPTPTIKTEEQPQIAAFSMSW